MTQVGAQSGRPLYKTGAVMLCLRFRQMGVNPIAFDLAVKAREFRRALERTKANFQQRTFEWYPYNSLEAIVQQLGPFLTSDVMETALDLPMVELGCGDGDLSFFFESLGSRVTAVDHELTNFNQMQGVRALRDALGSQVAVHSADLDGRFNLGGGPFGLALMVGLLYHIKNPFYLLEHIARASRYGVLTTRIAQKTPGGRDIKDEPLAYLVDATEMNGDSTNYWVFSETGLRRLLTRAGWSVLRFESTGWREGSDLTGARDERACCLLRSRYTAGSRVTLGAGWHELEHGTSRWTAREFVAVLKEPALRGAKISFRFSSIEGSAMVTATAGGIPLGAQFFAQAGEHAYVAPLPEALYGKAPMEFRFEVDRAVRASHDPRELALLVNFWKAGVETCDDNAPLEIIY